jgi:hypothetical protein
MTYIRPPGRSRSRDWWNSAAMYRYLEPACQRRSATLRGSPACLGGLDRITSNIGRRASADSRSKLTADTRSPKPLARAFSAAQSAALGVDVGGDDIWRAGARGGERQDARSRPDIRHALAGEVETIDEGRKGLAADEEAGMKHRWAHCEAETRRARGSSAPPRQD